MPRWHPLRTQIRRHGSSLHRRHALYGAKSASVALGDNYRLAGELNSADEVALVSISHANLNVLPIRRNSLFQEGIEGAVEIRCGVRLHEYFTTACAVDTGYKSCLGHRSRGLFAALLLAITSLIMGIDAEETADIE